MLEHNMFGITLYYLTGMDACGGHKANNKIPEKFMIIL